jgi:hypothetical protein
MVWLLILGLIGLVVGLWRLEVVSSQLGAISFQLGKAAAHFENGNRIPNDIREAVAELSRATELLGLIQSNTFGTSAGFKSVERAVLEGNRRARTSGV